MSDPASGALPPNITSRPNRLFDKLDASDVLIIGEGEFALAAKGHGQRLGHQARILDLPALVLAHPEGIDYARHLGMFGQGRVFYLGLPPSIPVNGRRTSRRLTARDIVHLLTHGTAERAKLERMFDRCIEANLIPTPLSEVTACGVPGRIAGNDAQGRDLVAISQAISTLDADNRLLVTVIHPDGNQFDVPFHRMTMSQVVEIANVTPQTTMIVRGPRLQNPFETYVLRASEVAVAFDAGVQFICLAGDRMVLDDIDAVRSICARHPTKSVYRLPG